MISEYAKMPPTKPLRLAGVNHDLAHEPTGKPHVGTPSTWAGSPTEMKRFQMEQLDFPGSPKLDDTASAPLPLAALGLQQEYPKRESVSESIRRWSVHADVVHDRTSMNDVIGEIRARSEARKSMDGVIGQIQGRNSMNNVISEMNRRNSVEMDDIMSQVLKHREPEMEVPKPTTTMHKKPNVSRCDSSHILHASDFLGVPKEIESGPSRSQSHAMHYLIFSDISWIEHGPKDIASPWDWSTKGLPAGTKITDFHDFQDMSVDWGVNGIPAHIRNTDWSGNYNNVTTRGSTSARLVVDWSNTGLPMAFEHTKSARWSHGALEAAYDPPMIQMDWSQNGLPKLGGAGLKWVKKANRDMMTPEIECDWSTIAMPMQIRGPIWSSSFQGMQRGMQSATPDRLKFVMNWAVKGLPQEAEGQKWTQHVGGAMAQRLRTLRTINKQITRDMGSPLNPKKNASMKNYDLTHRTTVFDSVVQPDDIHHDLHQHVHGHEKHQGSIKDVRSINRKNLHQQYKEHRTNANRKLFNKQLYFERLHDLERVLRLKREYRKKKRLQARERGWRLRAGIAHEETPVETMYVHKNPKRDITRFESGTRRQVRAFREFLEIFGV